jgi:hypothetical protein
LDFEIEILLSFGIWKFDIWILIGIWMAKLKAHIDKLTLSEAADNKGK